VKKRFQKLAFRAGCRARKFTRGVAIYQNVNEDLQRYGELIVNECIQILLEDNGATAVDKLLLEHFGVEE
jgi:hypothetical protein